jgi:hypothetical protein
MEWKRLFSILAIVAIVALSVPTAVDAASSVADLLAICNSLYAGVFGVPNSETFGPCQWDMALINASLGGSS